MRPESFHLIIGMPRADALRTLQSDGWKAKEGADAKHVEVDYDADKSFTLAFERGRLASVRFELYVILHDARSAFAEETAYLRSAFGEPKKKSKSVVVYDNKLPNVMAVLSNDPKSQQGQKGVGMVVVRYYDPR